MVSFIVMICVTVELLPHESAIVQVLVITAGQVPVGAESVPVTVPEPIQLSVQLSEVIGGTSAIHCTVTAGGTELNTGAIVSLILINWVTVVELPQESAMVQVLVITAGQVPVGAESVPVTVPEPIQLSVQLSEVIGGTSAIH